MRHGQADNNVNRVLVGRHVESHLTAFGIQQVEDTAKHLQHIPIDKIYVSPVIRTVETANIVSEILGIPYVIDERLYEIEIGKLVGMNYDDVINQYGNLFLKFYGETETTLSKHGVESFSAVKRRIKALMDEVAERDHDKNVLLISHLDPIKAAISILVDLSPKTLYHWHVRNAALTILKHESKIFSLSGVNIMSMHRYLTE
ncbi:histidine phosphatase family protein [Nitrososphaera sp. AFS]|jgi:2,3-bisphosphoglycerate-dependent phosphoglycerate mutase|uniref:histidine phosphatase family protein n=1 Tax=Nitrososphaera sp. AFS TaxID=2301191 RepID=UPI00139232E5|nr:histidine phosphatase family protein [Nitrososphaera sp. AFS]